MSEPLRQIAVVFCCLGMGAWPAMQRLGCCCATATDIAQRLGEEQRCDCCHPAAPAPFLPSKCECPAVAKTFEAIPSFAIKNYTQDFKAVDAVFTSVFQAARPGGFSLWEVVENLHPPSVPRHVLFCTFLE